MTKKTKAKELPGKTPSYPRHSLEKALRIPQAILTQNAGKVCSDEETAKYVGVKYNKGPYGVELNSSIKFGLLERPESGKVILTDLAKQILKPQEKGQDIQALRRAILGAPVISEVYTHYRGENLPDSNFFDNALTDKFKIPSDKVADFKAILFESLKKAELITEHDGKFRLLDVSADAQGQEKVDQSFKKLEKSTKVKTGETCFVMMPFADPLGSYYKKIYEPAIEKAGLKAVRADDEIFGAGKIMDQIWTGINSATVLIAELTGRNPNVFYELGLAHALQKPVVLISSNENDVPFDLNHIRVIYYDVTDPFWGTKLIDKVAENILSAISNPKEAMFSNYS